MALTDLETLKQFLNVDRDDTSKDMWLDSLRSAAEATVKSYCKRDFEPQEYTDFYSGSGTRLLPLRQRPVTLVSAVYVDNGAYFGTNPDGAFGSDSLLVEGRDYALQYDQGTTTSACGVLVRVGGVWPEVDRFTWQNKVSPEPAPTFGNIKVTYTAGYETIPQDLQYAVCWVVSFMKRNVTTGGVLGKESLGDYSYELLSPRFLGTMPPEISTARQILARYRNPQWP